MATAIIMPKVGISVESCIITKWYKNKGDEVKAGELLFSYETDKAAADEEAKESGVLLAILAEEGDEVPVLENVCVIGTPGEDISEFMTPAEPVSAEPAGRGLAPAEMDGNLPSNDIYSPLNGINTGMAGKISPRARALAEKSGVDLRGIGGTGPGGRIIERDVKAAIESGRIVTPAALKLGVSGAAAAGTGIGGRVTTSDLQAKSETRPESDVEVVKLSNIRKFIAKAMVESLSSMAQVTNHSAFDATHMSDYRKALKSQENMAFSSITINDIILYAVSRTLKNHRDLNAHLIGDEMHYYGGVHLGIAVDTERGLIVPTLFNADKMSLVELSVNAKALIREARAGTIAPDLLKGATFTVSNPGMLGVESFTPVINPPQTGILGICSIVERIRTVNGEIKAYPSMGLSLTYDHRAVDGAPAGRFLAELRNNLENFTVMLAAGNGS